MKPVEVAGVNLWAIMVAAAAAVALRPLWYWTWGLVRGVGREVAPLGTSDPPTGFPRALEYALRYAAWLLIAFAFARIIRLTTIETASHGMRLGAEIWLAFVIAVELGSGAGNRKASVAYMLDAGYRLACFVVMGCVIAVWPKPPSMGSEAGIGLFKDRCMSCHGNPNFQPPAPDPATLRRLPPEAIYASLTTGTMRLQGQGLTDEAKRRIAEVLAGRSLGGSAMGDAKAMANHCMSNPALTPEGGGAAWNGWGADVGNTRFQSGERAGLDARTVPRLTLKWAFGFPGGASAFGQPTIAAGHIFVGSDIGYVYSLDAASGCVYWSFKAQAAVRAAITLGPVEKDGVTGSAIYFGDVRANVYAVDAYSGSQLWTTQVDDHFLAKITGAPTLYEHTLFVPVASSEEQSAGSLSYPCCSFRGSVVALDANSGRQVWKTYTIPEEPRPRQVNSQGTQLFAPAGAGVWSAPTIDAQRHAVIVGTGNSYTEPASAHSDSVLALDMATGKVLWVFQATADDAFVNGCYLSGGRGWSENCPEKEHPDYDFGASPMLRALPGGSRILVAAQKSGIVFGLDPDHNGALRWKTNLADKPPPTTGLIVFGGAADLDNAYFGLTSGEIAALRLADGRRVWLTTIKGINKNQSPAHQGMSAAVSAIPGVVFVGGWDGVLHALSTDGGKVLWEFKTARRFETVNGIAAEGGSMGGPGATVGGGMLFVGSGYSVFGGDSIPGNVLLAFSAP